MSTTELIAKKMKLIEWVINSDDVVIEGMITYTRTFTGQPPALPSLKAEEELKEDIRKAEDDFRNGRVYSQHEVKKMIESW